MSVEPQPNDLSGAIINVAVLSVQRVFFFLDDWMQSMLVSIFHIMIYVVGFSLFYIAKPCSIYRIAFLCFILYMLLLSFLFDQCMFLSIEKKLWADDTIFHKLWSRLFGRKNNVRILLVGASILLFSIVLHDCSIIELYK
jgi:hypothetical protein